ncbi:MAG: family 43 glycosylhydrolase [bacterium]|nr:family 43 glycosylhydrolase [bacterium]
MQLQFSGFRNKRVIALIAVLSGILVLFQLQCTPQQKSFFPFEQFEKYGGNPILSPRGNGFESKAVFNPGVILDNGTFYLFYRAQDESGRSTIGLALSEDGMNFARYPEPVISPEYDYELPGGCEDPRIVKIEYIYYITYTGYSPKGTPSCLAVSKDLVNWEKLGPIAPNKSAAILNRKIDGKYWLYYGDTNIWIAHSTDMVHWDVVEKPVMRPRKGCFDEGLVEPGPPPIITEEGILLIYNGNIPKEKAVELGKKEGREKVREYNTGWALFSKEDPAKLIARCDSPFLTVTEDFEKNGQVNDVVFSEGLVQKDGKSYLYYGCADTYIGVAVSEKTWQEPEFILESKYIKRIGVPILESQGDDFEQEKVFNPAVIVKDETIHMIYRAQGEGFLSGSFGLAESKDGINFTRYKNNPIMKAEHQFERGGCEDPRIVKFGDIYYLFYNGNDWGRTPGNICLATSRDLIHWKKHGEILQPIYDWEKRQIKAPAPVPQKIKGKYWMYYQGEIESWKTSMGLAYSEDLIHWSRALEEPVLTPREGYFDSWGTEPGVAVVIDEGILLIYNGWGGDRKNTNKTGWALFSKEDPTKLIARCNYPIISLPYDHVFTEGMVRFKDEWYLYYGVADKWIEGVVVDFDAILSEALKN